MRNMEESNQPPWRFNCSQVNLPGFSKLDVLDSGVTILYCLRRHIYATCFGVLGILHDDVCWHLRCNDTSKRPSTSNTVRLSSQLSRISPKVNPRMEIDFRLLTRYVTLTRRIHANR